MKKHYHFVGIGGIGMGTLASLLLDQGFCVTGSDLRQNFLTKQLVDKGARITIGHCAENISSADYVVYSSAISQDNPELRQAMSKGIPIYKRAKLLATIMSSKKGIGVLGAHGKTTTTSMVSHLLKNAGFSPTVAIGGIVNNGSYSAETGIGDFFVAELDESDGSFLFFSNQYNILTNVDLEHVDFYPSWESILKAYGDYICHIPKHGCLIACGDEKNIENLLAQTQVKKITYGLGSFNDVHASEVRNCGFSSSYDLWHKNHRLGSIVLSVPGEHNIVNSLAVVCLGLELNIDFSIIKQSLLTYQGVQRRFSIRFQKNNVLVIEDYAHHPREIEATLATARHLDYKRLIVIFQPHRYSRTKKFLDEFARSFMHCDHVIVTDIYAASEKPLAGINPNLIIDKIKENKILSAEYLPMNEIPLNLSNLIRSGDMVVILGAGDIDQILKDLIDALDHKLKK